MQAAACRFKARDADLFGSRFLSSFGRGTRQPGLPTVTFSISSPPLARALAARNYSDPTPVQAAVLAADAAGRDLLVSAQTGSGKTVAYGLAIAENLLADAERFESAAAPLALIVAPTRELALQVQRELAWLYEFAQTRVVACVGGMDPRAETRELGQGAHIVVGTPGRLCDHLRRHRLDVSAVKAVVLDEADEMLDLGFREDLEFILETTPTERRTLLFSATLPRGIAALARQYQNEAFRIAVAGDEGGHADIDYRAIRIAASDGEHAVVNVLRFYESPGTIVFCNTRSAVKHLQTALSERGFSVVALSGELDQSERTLALQSLRDGRARVCVATDVAARGLDLPNVDLVIHAELPNDAGVLQHRSGRTGRAGRKGVSVLLVPPARRRRAEMMLDVAGIAATWDAAPSADDIRKLDHDRMLGGELFAEAATPDDLELAQALMAVRSGEEIAVALARIYRARLPSPEDMVDPGERGPRMHDERAPGEAPRGEAHDSAPRPRPDRLARHGMPEGSVWFRAAIGKRKKAEARWLLPMICRRGGIDKDAIGAIRIMEDTTEFEISANAAESFAELVARPDKNDNIRIDRMDEAPQRRPENDRPAREGARAKPPARRRERDAWGPKPDRQPDRERSRDDAPPRAFKKPRAFDPLRPAEPRADADVRKPKFGRDKPGGGKPDRDMPARDMPARDAPRFGKPHQDKPHRGKPYKAKADFAERKPPRDYAGASKKKKFAKQQKKKMKPW
jgi:ATP-dependent RNA helicase DeaD